MRKKDGRGVTTRVIIISLLVVIALVITAAAAVPYLRQQSKAASSVSDNKAAQATETTGAVEATEATAEDDNSWTGERSDGLITYNGKKYRYNSHLSNYLLLGIDTRSNIKEELEKFGGRRSDAIFLVSYDRKEEEVRILAIPRDTMTMITMYTEYGDSFGQMLDHLSLQYAYGDGREMSCEITSDAVSQLLYGVPIDGYTAISFESLPPLVDSVGGVTLTVPDDSLEDVYPEFEEGTEVKLTGKNVEKYLRYRDVYFHHQALVRMDRHKPFIKAYIDRVIELQSEDPHTIADIYETLEPHMVTNISNDVYLDLVGASLVGEIETLPGEGVATDLFDEYHVDDKALYKMILDVFYKEET